MAVKWVVAGVLVLLAASGSAGYAALSCDGGSQEATSTTITAVATTTTASLATSSSATAASSSSTTTSAVTTTTVAVTTTLDPLEAYRAAMTGWRDTYGPALGRAYTIMSGTDFYNPTPTQIQAAKDLDALMGPMTADLEAIEPPTELATAHAGFLASLERMAVGINDLATALERGQVIVALSSAAVIATAWQGGTADRTAIEQALGFSLSG